MTDKIKQARAMVNILALSCDPCNETMLVFRTLRNALTALEKLEAIDGEPPVAMPCGCSWHEKTSWTLCDECQKLECFQPPKNYKTALELFEGGDMNLKSSAGIREYRFSSYAIRRITNALTPKAARIVAEIKGE